MFVVRHIIYESTELFLMTLTEWVGIVTCKPLILGLSKGRVYKGQLVGIILAFSCFLLGRKPKMYMYSITFRYVIEDTYSTLPRHKPALREASS